MRCRSTCARRDRTRSSAARPAPASREFLQAWVLGMAAEYSPDRVTFLFVDYKGGSAFADCVELPHCVGLVTDLSPHLVRRALTSLRAELHHREHLLNRKKAKDLLELEKRRDPDTPPALVLVIDEFAALAGRGARVRRRRRRHRPARPLARHPPDHGDAATGRRDQGQPARQHEPARRAADGGRVRLERRGRRPGRRHASTRGSPAAASPRPVPGRLVPFQSGYAGGWTQRRARAPQVDVAELRFGSTQRWESTPDDGARRARGGPRPERPEAHRRAPGRPPRRRAGIPRRGGRGSTTSRRRSTCDELPPARMAAILLGMSDVPERQLQEPVYFEPDRDGHLAGLRHQRLRQVHGAAHGRDRRLGAAPRSARRRSTGSTSARVRSDPRDPAARRLDHPGRRRRAPPAHPAIARRGCSTTAASGSAPRTPASIREYRELTGRDEARIILLIDGLPQFRAEWEATTARMPFYQIFMRILGEGRPLGVHVVATRGSLRRSVPTAVSSNVVAPIVLRLSDENAYRSLGAPKDVLDERCGPGRAIVDGFETQIAVLGGTPNVAEQTSCLADLRAELRARGARRSPRSVRLPTEPGVRPLPDAVDGQPVLGIAEDTLARTRIRPGGLVRGHRAADVGQDERDEGAGPLDGAVRPEAKLFHFGGRRARLRDFRPWVRGRRRVPMTPKDLATELAELVADETVPGTDHDRDRGRPAVRGLRRRAAAEGALPGDQPQRALPHRRRRRSQVRVRVRLHRRLQGDRGASCSPDAFDGDALFKVPFPKVKRHDFPEGRGIFVQDGRAVTVQLPLVASD